jgi:hypothetical protein
MINLKNTFNKLLIKLHLKKAYWSGLSYKGIPIILRDDVPPNKLYIGQPDGTYYVVDINTMKTKKVEEVSTK